MTDRTRVAIGKDTRLPQIFVDLQSYFEFSFEMDELLRCLDTASTGGGIADETASREETRDENWRDTAYWEAHHRLPGRGTLAGVRILGHRGPRL